MTQRLDPRTLFRTVAIAEALTWAGLLVGMNLKWVVQSTEVGVKIFGPIHGVTVIIYVLTVVYARSCFRWDVRTLLLAVIASVPPFATVVFGIWADRHALLVRPVPTSLEPVPVAS